MNEEIVRGALSLYRRASPRERAKSQRALPPRNRRGKPRFPLLSRRPRASTQQLCLSEPRVKLRFRRRGTIVQTLRQQRSRSAIAKRNSKFHAWPLPQRCSTTLLHEDTVFISMPTASTSSETAPARSSGWSRSFLDWSGWSKSLTAAAGNESGQVSATNDSVQRPTRDSAIALIYRSVRRDELRSARSRAHHESN